MQFHCLESVLKALQQLQYCFILEIQIKYRSTSENQQVLVLYIYYYIGYHNLYVNHSYVAYV